VFDFTGEVQHREPSKAECNSIGDRSAPCQASVAGELKVRRRGFGLIAAADGGCQDRAVVRVREGQRIDEVRVVHHEAIADSPDHQRTGYAPAARD
jgi:hypothetical protein